MCPANSLTIINNSKPHPETESQADLAALRPLAPAHGTCPHPINSFDDPKTYPP